MSKYRRMRMKTTNYLTRFNHCLFGMCFRQYNNSTLFCSHGKKLESVREHEKTKVLTSFFLLSRSSFNLMLYMYASESQTGFSLSVLMLA